MQQEGGKVEDGRQQLLFERLAQWLPFGLSAVAGRGAGPSESHFQAKSSLSTKQLPIEGWAGHSLVGGPALCFWRQGETSLFGPFVV